MLQNAQRSPIPNGSQQMSLKSWHLLACMWSCQLSNFLPILQAGNICDHMLFLGFHKSCKGNVLRLCKYFHCNDTSNNPPRTPGHDKLCHVRPVLDAVSKTCLDNYKPPKEQTIEEGMIAFKERLSFNCEFMIIANYHITFML